LFISNQPYIEYQNAIVSVLIPEGFSFETVGFSILEPPSVAIMLDTLGKALKIAPLY
jgi:hypothetical protein